MAKKHKEEKKMFVVKEKQKDETLIDIDSLLARLGAGDYQCPTGTPTFSIDQRRWIIPDKLINLQEVTIYRVLTLLKYLQASNLRHTTRRDVWYGVTTGQWNLYDPIYCPKCHSTNTKTINKWTGRVNKDGVKVMTKIKTCQACLFEYTDLKDPYDALGGDLITIERLLGIEKESLGVHAGMKGFIFGSNRMSIFTPTRSFLTLSDQPTIMFDVAKAYEMSGFSKLIMLEKESFVNHLAPIVTVYGEEKPDFTFLDAIDAAIITSQGYEGKYNKGFVAKCVEAGIKPLSLHDADGDGIDMDLILQHHSMSGAHLPDYLICNPHRMGYFPSIGKDIGTPATPMNKRHIKGLKDLKKRMDLIDDPLYEDEIDVLINQGARWELQSMSALHPKAGQAYVVEYLRNRQIPVKQPPNIQHIQERICDKYSRKQIKEDLEYWLREKIEELIREKITDKVVEAVMGGSGIGALIDESINDLEDFPDLPTNREIYETWQDKISGRITDTTSNTEDRVINSFCNTEFETEIDETDVVEETDEKISIDIEKLIESIKLGVERNFSELEPKEARPDLYNSVLYKCEIPPMIAEKFKGAFKKKLAPFPLTEEVFDPESIDPYEPEEDFDELD